MNIPENYPGRGKWLALPGYGVLFRGSERQLHAEAQPALNVYNVTNELGLTEGNANSGVTQKVVNGLLLRPRIVVPCAGILTYKF